MCVRIARQGLLRYRLRSSPYGTKGWKMPPKSKRVLPGKRYPLNMRTTKELRDKIEQAAAASGRSLVQEVEFRLEQSFRREEDDRRRKEELESFGVKIVEE